MNNKLSDKDKRDWQNFISKKEKVHNKDLSLSQMKTNKDLVKTIDLHGFSLDEANKKIESLINQYFLEGVEKIVVITGKGLRSKKNKNPYVSKDFSILKNSVPEYINRNLNIKNKIKSISKAEIRDGGEGAFYIFLKKIKE